MYKSDIRRFFSFLLLPNLVIVVASCIFVDGRGLDLSRWRQEQILLSDFEMNFTVPGGQSASAPPLPTVRQLNLYRDLPSSKPSRGLYSHIWDYDGGLLRGVFGTLQMTVGVHQVHGNYNRDLTVIDNLQELIQADLVNTYRVRNEEQRQKGRTEFIVIPPEIYKRTKIGEREWLVYSLRGWLDRTFYSSALTPAHYVTVTFSFSDNSRGYKTTWRQDAQVVADQIAQSLEIRHHK